MDHTQSAVLARWESMRRVAWIAKCRQEVLCGRVRQPL